MTGKQSHIWALLNIAPTDDKELLDTEVRKLRAEHANNPEMLQQIETALNSHIAEQAINDSAELSPPSSESASSESVSNNLSTDNHSSLPEQQIELSEPKNELTAVEHTSTTCADSSQNPPADNTPITNTSSMQVSSASVSGSVSNSLSDSELSPRIELLYNQQQAPNKRRGFVPYFALAALFVLLLVGNSSIELVDLGFESEEPQVVLREPYWAEDLNVCNQAKQVQEDGAFEQCLALAEQGRVYAQMRVAWLFFDSEDDENLQASYDWMAKAGIYDDTSKLLSKIMLFVHGNSEDDKLRGYKGIVKQADAGFAGAEAYLALLYLLEENPLQKTANPIWLLEKAYRNDASYVGVLDLVRIYLNGLATRVDENKAVTVMREYADSFFPTSANNAAWMIATSQDLRVFSPSDALAWAKSVVEDPSYSDNFGYVDTLAAAYAADGQFEQAVVEQKKAIELLQKSQYNNEQDLQDFNTRLTAFSEGKQVTYFDMGVDAKQLFPSMKQELESLFLNQLQFATEQP